MAAPTHALEGSRPFGAAAQRAPASREHEVGRLPRFASVALGPTGGADDVLQPKMAIGAVTDPLECEADEAAARVTSMSGADAAAPAPLVAPVPSARAAGEETLRTRAAGRLTERVPSSVEPVLRSSGVPLDPSIQATMERGFGCDFSRVRVHADAPAAASARDTGALAYTVGHHVAFAEGRYAPRTTDGMRLLAHELTHVVQQGHARPLAPAGEQASVASSSPEAGAPAGTMSLRSAPVGLQRAPAAPPPPPPPPGWLGSLRANAVHVQGDIWDVSIPSLGGNVWVGPYDQLSRYINAQGYGGRMEAAHIVGGEHLGDLSAGFPYDQAPCVAVDKSLHATWTKGTTSLQTDYLAGRRSRYMGRTAVGGEDVIELYDELYDGHPEMQEMARNIVRLPSRGPGGSVMPPRGPSPMDAHDGSPMPKPKPAMPEPSPAVPKPKSPMDAHAGPAMPKPSSPMPKPSSPMPKPTSPMDAHAGPAMPKPKSPMDARAGPAMPKPSSPMPKPTSPMDAHAGPAMPKPSSPVDVPTAGRLSSRRATVEYDAAAADPSAVVRVKNIDLSDYPVDRPGVVTRFFRDRPVLRKLATAGAHAAADYLRNKMLDLVMSHFEAEIEQARAEFEAKFPDVATLSQRADLDKFVSAYGAALWAMRTPDARRKAAMVLLLVGTPEKDRETRMLQLQRSWANAPLDPSGKQSFDKVGRGYENALADLASQASTLQLPLPAIADDIDRRAAVLKDAGSELENLFWTLVQSPAVAFPPVESEALTIKSLADDLIGLGGAMDTFGTDVRSRAYDYQRFFDALDRELVTVGTELDRSGMGTGFRRVGPR